tara:strand:+ start:1508 stop:1702 length:195 start_codon:yes stop_codon:yes gene_type:complete
MTTSRATIWLAAARLLTARLSGTRGPWKADSHAEALVTTLASIDLDLRDDLVRPVNSCNTTHTP